MSEERIYLKDLRPEGCVKGAKAFLIRNGFNWREFCENGIKAEDIESLNDSMAQIFVDKVRGRR